MARVLLLYESGADFQTGRSVEQLARQLGPEFSVITRSIGARGDYPNAAAALYRLRRLRGDVDLIHTWGSRPLTLAAMATRLPLMYSPDAVTGPRTINWARAVLNFRPVQVICPTSTLRRLHVERGVGLDRTHLIRPGVDFARVNRRRDTALRERLGFGPNDRVVLAVGEHTHAANHVAALWAIGILRVLDERYRVLLWGRGRLSGYLVRFAKKVGRPEVAVAEEAVGRRMEFEEVLPAADMAMVTPKGLIPTLPVQICMAAGLPIVSSVSYTTGELLEDRHTGLLVPQPHPKMLAKRVSELYDDARLQWSIADRARAEAYDYFSLSRFLSQYRTAYRQLAAGKRVDVTDDAGSTSAAGSGQR